MEQARWPGAQRQLEGENRSALREMVVLRNVSIAGQALGFMGAAWAEEWELPVIVLVTGLGMQVLFNHWSWWRHCWPSPVQENELLVHILADVLFLAGMGHALAGSAAPLVGLFLVPFFLFPLTTAAAFLAQARMWAVVLLTVGFCSWLILSVLQRPDPHVDADDLQLPLSSLALTILLSAGLIVLFVGQLAARARDRDRRLAEARQLERDSAFLVEIGSLATGAAHELGTPLNTIGVLAEELLREREVDRLELNQSLRVISDQVALCKATLADLANGRAPGLSGGVESVAADEFVEQVIARWLRARPDVTLVRRSSNTPPPRLPADKRLAQGLVNLLNNAADASPGEVELDCTWHPDHATLCVRDRGPGLAAEPAAEAPQRAFTTKRGRGMGLGLMLARTAIVRAGGRLTFSPRKGGGTLALVVLPAFGAPGVHAGDRAGHFPGIGMAVPETAAAQRDEEHRAAP